MWNSELLLSGHQYNTFQFLLTYCTAALNPFPLSFLLWQTMHITIHTFWITTLHPSASSACSGKKKGKKKQRLISVLSSLLSVQFLANLRTVGPKAATRVLTPRKSLLSTFELLLLKRLIKGSYFLLCCLDHALFSGPRCLIVNSNCLQTVLI